MPGIPGYITDVDYKRRCYKTNLVAALDGCDCRHAKTSLRTKTSSLRNLSGSSVVTDGLTISDSVVLTTYLQVEKTSTSWYSIQKFTLTQVDSLLRLLRLVLQLSSQQAEKRRKKKDLAGIAMSYGYVYVAQIAMGADFNQTVKAIAEAEAYPGPSLIIAYAPCINHGIQRGVWQNPRQRKN